MLYNDVKGTLKQIKIFFDRLKISANNQEELASQT